MFKKSIAFRNILLPDKRKNSENFIDEESFRNLCFFLM